MAKPASAPGAPTFCTFACPHSAFPPAETAGACRTMAAVYCKRLRKLVHKNMPCQGSAVACKKPRSRLK
jgi:hypothetical protein